MRSCAMKMQAMLWASGAAALALFAAERTAHGQVNAGAEVGIAHRSGDPNLSPGFAAGAHAELKLIPMLSVGAYYLWYDLSLADQEGISGRVDFQTFGGRVRFTLPLPNSSFRPYAYAGLGRVGVTYPTSLSLKSMNAGAVPLTNFQAFNDGHFLELPIGLGLGYQAAKIVQLSADFALRPGFGFGGDAYSSQSPIGETKMGYTFMLGAAIDL